MHAAMAMENSVLVFYVNGRKITDEKVDPSYTLLQYLRLKLKLCGAKESCGEGGCGACTVMVSTFNRKNEAIEHLAINACLLPICSMHGKAVTTVEGLGSTKTTLHPVQERIGKSHGTQCGYCTPGMVMSMYALLRNRPQPNMEDLQNAFQGNLCRCTGYRPILDGFKTFTKEFCCNGNNGNRCCRSNQDSEMLDGLFSSNEFTPYDPTQEPIFPPELKLANKYDNQYLCFEFGDCKWIRPTSLTELVDLKSKYPDAYLVVGNTEVGIVAKSRGYPFPVVISPCAIPELYEISYANSGITIGSANTLSTFEIILQEAVSKNTESATKIFSAIISMLRQFANPQIRNVASIAGNVVTASPISDLNPLFSAANCTLNVISTDGERKVVMDGSFFRGYRQTAIQSNEILVSITVPFTNKNDFFFGYKQARRCDDDIAIVNAGMRVLFKPASKIVQNLSLAYGGMAETTVMAEKTMETLIGRTWNESLLEDAIKMLADDLPLDPSAPGSMIEFRKCLTTGFFFKFYLSVLQELDKENAENVKMNLPKEFCSAVKPLSNDSSKSSQLYEIVPDGQSSEDLVGRPVPHYSALEHATGEAVYCDDIPHYDNELYLGIVTSTRAHAKILSIDANEALTMEGVVAFFCHKDLDPSQNVKGTLIQDEEIFASEKVTSQGQLVGVIVGINKACAQRAIRKVKVEYEDIEPVILTIEDAIKRDSVVPFEGSISKGDVEAGFQQSDHVLEGEVRLSGQEHFYFETQSTLAVPKGEKDEMELFVSTQHPTPVQMGIAKLLGVPANRIICRTKRIGGGFGGKESSSLLLAYPCALVAKKLNRPVRCVLDREEDMVMTGTRHPYLGKYKVGFTNEGKVTAVDVQFYSNSGSSLDVTPLVMMTSLTKSDSAYNVPNYRAKGYLCKTNIISGTSFRGFGYPQAQLITENWINDVADVLKMDAAKVRGLNLYRIGAITPYNQVIENNHLIRVYEECLKKSDYEFRREQTKLFNKENRWKKRGMALVMCNHGISFILEVFHQAGALVNVYADGSVMLTHGGVEMGQGLHTKMIQVASRVFGVPSNKVHVSQTSTETVPNSISTAASLSTDFYGMAVMYACETIKQRLEPIVSANPKGSWDDWIAAAFLQRVALSATGFYKAPIGELYNIKTNKGRAFTYYTMGACCSEVEIDCLTGDHKVLRTDIVMDVGQSINPAIDIGQIEGGFVQGYGLYVLEELRFSPEGRLLTRGPGTYKIPGFGNIPSEFNVTIVKGSSNPRAVYSSKAIGEPPVVLASSVYFAIKDAIKDARQNEGLQAPFRLDSPASAERIRMACVDRFTRQFPPADEDSFIPWSVIP